MPKLLFLDESGDHNLTEIQSDYPIFALCGVVMESNYHDTTATEYLNVFKENLFRRRDIILHTADFTRNQHGFEAMADHEFRIRFFKGLADLITQLDFRIIACVIKKQEHLRKYGLNALDPYFLSLSVVVERFAFDCRSSEGLIVAESRDPNLDRELELAFLDLKIRGTQFVAARKIVDRIRALTIRKKKENLAGLQVADLVATPIGRHLLGKTTYNAYSPGQDFFSVVRQKFRVNWEGKIEGFGLVTIPK